MDKTKPAARASAGRARWGCQMMTPSETFWASVAKTDGCWEWQGWRKPRGYGQLKWGEKRALAHRVAAFLSGALASLDADDCVLHHCDNPPCCRPDHLFIGTRADNNRDAARKGRIVSVTGDKHPCVKVSDDSFGAILARLRNGESIGRLSAEYGITRQTLSKRLRRHAAREGVNPSHLFAGTRSNRTRDRVDHGISRNMRSAKTHCVNGHPYVEGRFRLDWKGARQCKDCEVENNRRRRAERRAAIDAARADK